MKIVKSISVVDDHTHKKNHHDKNAQMNTVIKRGALDDTWVPQWQRPPEDAQSHMDELNRLKVDIAQAKAEVKTHMRELEKIQAQAMETRQFLQSEDEVVRKTRTVIERAEREAEKTLEEARQKGEALTQQMKDQGYLEGFDKGFEEARNEFVSENQPRAELIADLIERLTEFEREQIAKNEDQLLKLVTAVAEKIIVREIKTKPILIIDMLYETLDANKREEFIKITFSPNLLPLETKAGKEIKEILENMNANIDIYVNEDFSDGACIIETPKGFTDISISTQLNNLNEALSEDEITAGVE